MNKHLVIVEARYSGTLRAEKHKKNRTTKLKPKSRFFREPSYKTKTKPNRGFQTTEPKLNRDTQY